MTETSAALERVLRALADAGSQWREGHGQVTARCPAHEDSTPSLTVRDSGGKVLLCCHAGCATGQIVDALGLTLADLFDADTPDDRPPQPQAVAAYEYTDAAGTVLFRKLRYVPKTFKVQRPGRGGGWQWGMGTAERVLYRLPEVTAAIRDGRLVYVVEGEKDADRAAGLGVTATCNFEGATGEGQRPKWRPAYGDALRGAHVVIVVDHDTAGYAHGRAVAQDLAGKAASVRLVRGLAEGKGADLSDHLDAGHGLDELVDLAPDDQDDQGDQATAGGKDAPKESVATQLVKLTENHYRLGCTPDGEPYAIPTHGPPIVRLLRGGRGSLRAELADAFYATTHTAASQSALADACSVIEGKAMRVDPEQLHLRVAGGHGRYVLDLGDQTGRAVLVTPAGWQMVNTPPVLFRRTALTGPLPEPARDGALANLWDLLNVQDTYRPVLAAVLVAALMPQVPHPILALTGEQGSGKSTAARIIAATLDTSPAQLRKSPRDLDTWTTAAAGSWVVALDNVSTIPDWLSDALCRASTGDGDVRRRLYSDGDLHVIAFRRVVLLNGIDLGALRDDLADRLVTVHLDRITDQNRCLDATVTRRWQRTHPQILGALLDLAVQVLAALPSVQLDTLPRMADFAYVLAAVDQVLGTTGLDTYRGLRAELAEDAFNSDPVLGAIKHTITTDWTGTAAELLTAITPDDDQRPPPKDWPRTAVALRGLLTRRSPTLRRLGWTVEPATDNTHSKVKRTRLIPPGQSQGETHPRNPRNPRTEDLPAAQHTNGAAGVSAGVAGANTRTPAHPRKDTRSPEPTVPRENGASAGVAGVAGTTHAPSLSAAETRALHLVTTELGATILDPTGTDGHQ